MGKMEIDVEFEPYCAGCPNKERELRENVVWADGIARYIEQEITCRHIDLCRRLKSYLEGQG